MLTPPRPASGTVREILVEETVKFWSVVWGMNNKKKKKRNVYIVPISRDVHTVKSRGWLTHWTVWRPKCVLKGHVVKQENGELKRIKLV